MAIADKLEPLTHEQVVAVENRAKPTFINLVKQIVQMYRYKKVVLFI
jgi:purine-nucleoside phosphorylase